MPASTVAANAILDAIFQKTSPAWGVLASPPDLFCHLFKTAPAAGDSGGTLDAKKADYTSYAGVDVDASDFAEPSGGSIATAAEIAFPQATGGSALCTHAGITDAATGGNILFWGLLAPSALKTFIAETEDNDFVSPGHGFSDTAEVRLILSDDGALPGGFDGNTKYYVRDATSDSFKLAATSGGTAITITSDGYGMIGIDGSLNVTNNVTPKIAIGNLTLTMS